MWSRRQPVLVVPAQRRESGIESRWGAADLPDPDIGRQESREPADQWDEFKLQVFDDPWYRRDEWYPWNKKVPAPAGHPFNGLKDFQGEFDWGVIPGREESGYGDMRAVEYGEKFLAKSHGKPFFLAIGLWHPHIPMFAPQRYFDTYPPDKVRLPETSDADLDDDDR